MTGYVYAAGDPVNSSDPTGLCIKGLPGDPPPPRPSTSTSLQQPLDTKHRPATSAGDMRLLSLRAVCEVDAWGRWDCPAPTARWRARQRRVRHAVERAEGAF